METKHSQLSVNNKHIAVIRVFLKVKGIRDQGFKYIKQKI